jgi:predicted DNA-binding transcriptional regulator YafY
VPVAVQAKSERLMNLVICLLVARGFVPRSRIREMVPGYAGQSDEAFERMFERDKDELREVGVPIETGSHDALFDDEPGYRIRRSEFELPPLDLAPDEAAVLGLAARVWQDAGLAGATSRALLKLRAVGVDVDAGALAGIEPRMAADEPAFWPLWQGVRDRRRVRFAYRRPDDAAPAARTLEPWSVLSWYGRWYVVGHDVGRDATRMFRMSRIEGAVRPVGRRAAFVPPPADQVRAAATALAPPRGAATAQVLVRGGAGIGLRRRALAADPAEDGRTLLTVPFADTASLAAELAGYGDAVAVVAPAAVAAAVRDHLQATLDVLDGRRPL